MSIARSSYANIALMGISESNHEAFEHYDRFRSAIAMEASWSAQRTTWLVTANAFLATAGATLGDANLVLTDGAAMMRRLLPGAAVLINLGTLAMLAAAEIVTRTRVSEYREKFETRDDAPQGAPNLLGTRGAHRVGAYVPMFFALVLTAGWIVIGLA